MFSFFVKKGTLIDSGLFKGFIDFHSHILPGVDDGVGRDEEALSILEWYEQMGIKRTIFTPHVMEDYPKNNPVSLREHFEVFKEKYSGSVELHLAAEYMIDSNFDGHLEGGDMLTLWDNYLLVETSYMAAPESFEETLQEVMSKGYFPVLAHPERYLYLPRERYQDLHDMGVLFQLNLASLLGGYGKEVQSRAEYLLNGGFYSVLGSDIHSKRRHPTLYSTHKLPKKLMAKLVELRDSSLALMEGNL